MRMTIRVTGSLAEEDVSEEQRAVLLTAFRSWKAS
jgi:hypothetical protein